MHPQRAGAGLHTIGVQGTAPGLHQSCSLRASKSQKNSSSQSRKYSIPPVFVLGQAQLQQRLERILPTRTHGNPPEPSKAAGASGPHTPSLLSRRICPENSLREL